MKGRTGFVIGLAVGYVVGAKLGRSGSPRINEPTPMIVADPTRSPATTDPRSRVQQVLSDQLRIASSRLRSSAG